jgi:hypothetical protein
MFWAMKLIFYNNILACFGYFLRTLGNFFSIIWSHWSEQPRSFSTFFETLRVSLQDLPEKEIKMLIEANVCRVIG